MKLGKRLKSLLNQKDLTQRDLARHFGWGDTTVSNYISGNRQPDLETTQALADFFDVTLDYLLGRTDNPKEYVTPKIPENWEQVIRRLTEQGLSAEDVEAAIEFIRAAKKMREG